MRVHCNDPSGRRLMPPPFAESPRQKIRFHETEILGFLSTLQKTWLAYFPSMTRRAQQHIVTFLCVWHRTGCQFGELSGHIKQIFLLDDATIKERIRAALAANQITVEPSGLSSRSVILPTRELLERFDHYLVSSAQALNALTGPHGHPPLRLTPGKLDEPRRRLMASVIESHVAPFQTALETICLEQGLSKARSLEARRNLLSMPHWSLIARALDRDLRRPDNSSDSLADQLAADLLNLTGQNFQTSRDHIAYLMSIGVFERRPGKTLHIGLPNAASQHFQHALRNIGAELAMLATELSNLSSSSAGDDLTIRMPGDAVLFRLSDATLQMSHQLVIVSPKPMAREIALGAGSTIIGRAEPSTVLLLGHNISRTHFRIDIADRKATITDLNSTNGTYLDGQRLKTSAPLKHKSQIEAGGYVMSYEIAALPRSAKA